jgi:hypothetical protein
VWFLADPKRTDLALIDSRSLVRRKTYTWFFSSEVFLGGVRPDAADWIVLDRPGWFAGEGWHLTPETAGLAHAMGRGLDVGPIAAWVRRRAEPASVLIGGRHLGKPTDPALAFCLKIDGRQADIWTVGPPQEFFLRVLSLPAGALEGGGDYATLEVDATAVDGRRVPGLATIEQFDLQSAGTIMAGYDEGWYEQELNPATGQIWRWMGRVAKLRVVPDGHDLTLRVAGDAPSRNFDRPSHVVVRAGETTLLTAESFHELAWTIHLPAEALARANGIVTIETDQTFRPADRGRSADRRSLGLQIYRVTLAPAS